MKILFSSMTVCLLLVGCGSNSSNGGSGTPGNPIQVTQFTSPHDPCLEKNCTDQRSISYTEALSILQQNKLADEKGLQITTQMQEEDSYWVWDADLGDAKEVNCQISYTQTRTLVDMDENYYYVEEINSHFSYLPESTDCEMVANDTDYFDREVIAREDKPDFSSGISELFRKFFFQLLKVDGELMMRVSGTITGTYEIEQAEVEVEKGIKYTTSLDSMIRLTTHLFNSTFFNHGVYKDGDRPSHETLDQYLSHTSNVDVSHVDITSMDPCDDIEDRTEDNALCPVDVNQKTNVQASKLTIDQLL